MKINQRKEQYEYLSFDEVLVVTEVVDEWSEW